jgi:hypothetical protein
LILKKDTKQVSAPQTLLDVYAEINDQLKLGLSLPKQATSAPSEKEVKQFRQLIRAKIVKQHENSSMKEFNEAVLKNEAICSNQKIPIRLLVPFLGRVFEDWLNDKGTTEGKFKEKPTFFQSSTLPLSKPERKADGYDDNILLDAKANIKGKKGRAFRTEDGVQMEDYKEIIKKKEEWQNQKGEVLRFDFVRYHFNDAETEKKWRAPGKKYLQESYQSDIGRED